MGTSGADWQQVSLPDADLEVRISGAGDPLVLVQTAVTADELLPVAEQPAVRDGFRVVLYHRRGYAGSSPVDGPGSIERDARDCRQLLAALGIDRAHVAGVSYSAAVAMHLAASAPDAVQSLSLIEPPPRHTPSADEFVAACEELVADFRRNGAAAALDRFMGRLVGPGWRQDIERRLPGATAQVDQDAATFFATDLPALLAWRFGPEDARRITQPVLYVGGTDSGPWFAEVRELVLAWLPQAGDVVVDGADHSLAITHADQVAAAMAAFLHRHPLDP